MITKKCAYCGKTFSAKYKNRKFCTEKCSEIARRRAKGILPIQPSEVSKEYFIRKMLDAARALKVKCYDDSKYQNCPSCVWATPCVNYDTKRKVYQCSRLTCDYIKRGRR